MNSLLPQAIGGLMPGSSRQQPGTGTGQAPPPPPVDASEAVEQLENLRKAILARGGGMEEPVSLARRLGRLPDEVRPGFLAHCTCEECEGRSPARMLQRQRSCAGWLDSGSRLDRSPRLSDC